MDDLPMFMERRLANFRGEPVRFGKRAFREPIRFGKRSGFGAARPAAADDGSTFN